MLGMSEMQLISVFNKHKVSILVYIYNRGKSNVVSYFDKAELWQISPFTYITDTCVYITRKFPVCIKFVRKVMDRNTHLTCTYQS